jgi:hypothetical protein
MTLWIATLALAGLGLATVSAMIILLFWWMTEAGLTWMVLLFVGLLLVHVAYMAWKYGWKRRPARSPP